MGIELQDMAWDDLDLDQRGDARLAVGLGLRTQAEIAKTAHKVRDIDIRLELVAEAQQRLLVGLLEDDVVMLVADGEISLLVVTPRGLRQAENALVVRRRPLKIRASKPDIAKLKNLRSENSCHDLLQKSAASAAWGVNGSAQPLTALNGAASASAAGFNRPSADALSHARAAGAVTASAASQAGSAEVSDRVERVGEGAKSARASITFWPI